MRLLLKALAPLAPLSLSSCMSLAVMDANMTSFALGNGYAPEWCNAEGLTYELKHTDLAGMWQACKVPAAECVTMDSTGHITMYLPHPESVSKAQYEFTKQHGECHVYQMRHQADFSHRVFQRLAP